MNGRAPTAQDIEYNYHRLLGLGSGFTEPRVTDYWGHDEKYPQNRLPYIDQLRALIMIEPATRLAALRTGRNTVAGASVDREALERRLGLDVPVWVQYGRWLGGIVLRGNLGESLMGRGAVAKVRCPPARCSNRSPACATPPICVNGAS